MTPTQIIALVRDAFIVGALIWIIAFIYRAGENADVKTELASIEKQLAQNSATEARWSQEFASAEAQRYQDMQTVATAINSQRAPVRLCSQPGSPRPLPGAPTTPTGSTASAGGGSQQAGKDLRPALNAYELELEGYLASCRAVLAEWPK